MKKSLNRKHTDTLLYTSLKAAYLFVNRHKEKFGLMWSEVLLLKHLQDRKMIRISDAAKFLEIPVFKASRLVSKLEKYGYAERTGASGHTSTASEKGGKQRKQDMRSVGIHLTADGAELLEKIDEYNYRKIMEHITEFSAREIKGMMRAAEKLDLLLGVRRDE